MIRRPEDTYQGKAVRKVLTVCLGNICRSPMAEYLLRDKLSKAGVSDVQVTSAGLLDMEGRSAAPEIAKILSEKGISMSDHRSRKLSGRLIQENDLVVVMEIKQREEILNALPMMADKVWLLSQFNKVPEERDIRDPYGMEAFHYKNCYNDMYFLVEYLGDFLIKNDLEFAGNS